MVNEPDDVLRDLMRTCLYSVCDTPSATDHGPLRPIYYCGLHRPGRKLCVLAHQTCEDAEPFPASLDH